MRVKKAAPQQSPAGLAGCWYWYLACSAVEERHSAVGERHLIVVDRLAELLGRRSHSVPPSARLSGELDDDE